MAADDKTEKPTAKRRGEARKKGQVAKSTDLNGALVLIAGLMAVSLMAGKIVTGTATIMTNVFGDISHPGNVSTHAGLSALLHQGMMTLLTTVAPIFAVCIAAAVLVNVAQTGLRPSFQKLKPSFARLNPVSGFKNTFGPRIAFEAAKAIAKVAVVGGVVALALIPDLTHSAAGVGTTPVALGKLMDSGVRGIVERAALGYLLIGIADFIYQRHRTEKALKMTKQEIKEEGKQYQLPPEVRGAIRRRQIQQSRARMMAAIPKASVVVTNPTHYAVALEYSVDQPAPVVVAKGTDHIALQIRKIAEEHGIPIVPDPPLARELFRVVELGQMIPADLYQAVAQILAFVYRVANRKRVGV